MERTWSLGAWLFRVFQILPVGTEIFIGMSSEKTGTGSAFMNFIRLSSKTGREPQEDHCVLQMGLKNSEVLDQTLPVGGEPSLAVQTG